MDPLHLMKRNRQQAVGSVGFGTSVVAHLFLPCMHAYVLYNATFCLWGQVAYRLPQIVQIYAYPVQGKAIKQNHCMALCLIL